MAEDRSLNNDMLVTNAIWNVETKKCSICDCNFSLVSLSFNVLFKHYFEYHPNFKNFLCGFEGCNFCNSSLVYFKNHIYRVHNLSGECVYLHSSFFTDNSFFFLKPINNSNCVYISPYNTSIPSPNCSKLDTNELNLYTDDLIDFSFVKKVGLSAFKHIF